MIINTETPEMYQARDFIATNWAAFVSHIREQSMTEEQAETEAQHVYEAIGGEA